MVGAVEAVSGAAGGPELPADGSGERQPVHDHRLTGSRSGGRQSVFRDRDSADVGRTRADADGAPIAKRSLARSGVRSTEGNVTWLEVRASARSALTM